MAVFTALAALATVGGTLASIKQQKKAEANAKAEAKAQEDKAREASALRGPKEQEVRTKIGVTDTEELGVANSDKRGTNTRQSATGLGGMAVSASKIGGL